MKTRSTEVPKRRIRHILFYATWASSNWCPFYHHVTKQLPKSRGFCFNMAPSGKVHIFSFSLKPKIAHRCFTIHHIATHFRGLCVPTGFFCMTLQVDVVVPPTYSVKWTVTFWLISLIPQDHAPIVYVIPLLWVLCMSEIAKIVDPVLWNSTSFIWAGAWITSSSSTENTLHAPDA